MNSPVASRRACLIGVPTYDDPGISNLPVVRNDVARLQTVLEASNYQVETLCPGASESGVSCGKLRSTISRACGNAAENETLLIYFSGHGGNVEHKDYLVPSDAYLDDAADVTSYLLPVDFIAHATRECQASLVLFVIDACREGMKLDTKSRVLRQFNEDERVQCERRTVITVHGCRTGQYAHIHKADDPGNGYSLFTESLIQVLDVAHPATEVGEILEQTECILEELWRKHGKSRQEVWVLGETRAS